MTPMLLIPGRGKTCFFTTLFPHFDTLPNMSRPVNLRRRRKLALKWEITLVLLIKLLLLYGIWALWFDQPMPKEDRADNTSRIILNK